MKKYLIVFLISVCFIGLSISSAQASSVLTGNLTVDNQVWAYISTSDSEQGTLVATGSNWQESYSINTVLEDGVDYYLHVYSYDYGGAEGFIGDFTLTGGDHVFCNDSSYLLTNTTDWKGNNTGWGEADVALVDLGEENIYPWNWGFLTRTIDDNARWIWAGPGNGDGVDAAYFSTKITALNQGLPNAVAEPATIFLVGIGLLGAAGIARRKK